MSSPPPSQEKLSGSASKWKIFEFFLWLINFLNLCPFYYRLVPGRASPAMSESDRDSSRCHLQWYIRISIHSRTRLKHDNNNPNEHCRYVLCNHDHWLSRTYFRYFAPCLFMWGFYTIGYMILVHVNEW